MTAALFLSFLRFMYIFHQTVLQFFHGLHCLRIRVRDPVYDPPHIIMLLHDIQTLPKVQIIKIRMPQAIIVSARRNAFAAASVPCMPIMPKNCLSDAG